MSKIIRISLLVFIIGITSCSSSFITRTKNKNIKLNSFTKNGISIGIENPKSIIYFNKKDIIDLYEYEISKGELGRSLDLIYNIASFEVDTILNEEKLKGTIPFLEHELKFHELLKKGKAKIIWKGSRKKLYKIKYKFERDKLGGESAYFLTKEGIKFYEITLAFGE
jgi:hypothetical protein